MRLSPLMLVPSTAIFAMAASLTKDAANAPLLCLAGTSLKPNVFLPQDSRYATSEGSYWSNTAKITPACIVQPTSASETADFLKALIVAKQPFAVRSGGHAPLAGTNNIAGGVTIDLKNLNTITYDKGSKTVTFGPGVRWRDVFAALQPHKRVVAGGREGQTGVGGFLLGGGNAWITAREGFACDNVISYEVVLANGKIVTVTKDNEQKDLWRALKGGWNNFGIVTKFTMRTVANEFIYGGVTVSPKAEIPRLIIATENFTKNVPKYPDSSLITVIGYLEAVKDIVISLAMVEVTANEKSPAWAEFNGVGAIMDTRGKKTMLDMGLETALAADQYDTWSTITIKNDRRIMTKANEIHERLVKELLAYIPGGDFTTQLIFQPVPTLFAKNSVAKGGNVLGLERNKDDGMLVQINTMVKTRDQEQYAEPRVRAAFEDLKKFAKTIPNGLFEWVYVNYADSTQDVIKGYGSANVKFMKTVAAKYDPTKVFQDLCVGGFKVSDA